MKLSRWLIPALASALVSAHAYAGECRVRVEKGPVSIEDDGSVLADMNVRALKGCDSGCHGFIEFRVHYANKKGDLHFYARGQEYRIRDSDSADVTFKGYESYCNSRSLGPCDFKQLEITSVSCLD